LRPAVSTDDEECSKYNERQCNDGNDGRHDPRHGSRRRQRLSRVVIPTNKTADLINNPQQSKLARLALHDLQRCTRKYQRHRQNRIGDSRFRPVPPPGELYETYVSFLILADSLHYVKM